MVRVYGYNVNFNLGEFLIRISLGEMKIFKETRCYWDKLMRKIPLQHCQPSYHFICIVKEQPFSPFAQGEQSQWSHQGCAGRSRHYFLAVLK